MSSGGAAGELEDLRAQSARIKAEALEAALAFLRSELEVAATLMSVAQTTSRAETARRNLDNASIALKTVEQYIKKLDLEPAERGSLGELHAALCARLANLRAHSHD
jgi:aryl-alcohol dehydrogenase-like predicted oxidoreductase